jgi:LmbE family N-acetylglucosaminyl deacetylase
MGMQSVQTALVLSPHPDDESLGCGGTIKLISSSGGQVDVVYMTRGRMGVEPGARATPDVQEGLAKRRTAEAEEACRILGVNSVTFLEGRDTRLATQPQLAQDILRLLLAKPYHSIFCPWPRDSHTDHMATYQLLHWALRQYNQDIDVWLYEVWAPLEPNIAIAIDTTIEAKIQAIRAHQSQMAVVDYETAFRGLAAYRSLNCPSAKYAEAFFTCDSLSLLKGQDLPWLKKPPGDNGG